MADRPRMVADEFGFEHKDREEPVENLTTWVFEEGTFKPAAKLTEGKQYSIITDYLGTPVQMHDGEGKLFWDCSLDIYGKVGSFTGRSLSDCPFRYQGQYEDEETGLYYNRFRYYSPEEGMYISQDPIGLAGNNPTFYGYVRDVNSWVDIFGLECWNTARKNFWKNEAKNNQATGKYSKNNLKRMSEGKAPKMTVEVIDRRTGKKFTKDYSIELHHDDIPQRIGGEGVHDSSNLKIVDPWEHEAKDPYRHVGANKRRVIKGVDTW